MSLRSLSSGLPGKLSYLALALLLVSALACSRTNKDLDSANEISRASYLIDRGQYSEAIYTLEARLKAHPEDDRARVQLASAYAARSGILLSHYTAFAGEMIHEKDDENGAGQSFGSPVVTKIMQVLLVIEKVVRVFDSIPDLDTDAKLDDIRKAEEVLAASQTLKNGGAIYRALLRASLFKHSLVRENRLRALGSCEVQLEDVVPALTDVKADVSAILNDVALGVKDEKAGAKMHKISNDLDRNLKNLETRLAKLKEKNQAGVAIALPLIKQKGFRCD